MQFLNFRRLEEEKQSLRREWESRKPFRYIVFENILYPEAAESIHKEYPDIRKEGWAHTTYINQKGKYEMSSTTSPVFKQVFEELHSKEFVKMLEQITGIKSLLPDESLFGAGLHQSVRGAFLDVHVDFNLHPETHFHRRLNALIYMNKDWKTEYNGFLELWDMTAKKRLEYLAPEFNRCVIFETNEISFHGHPLPLNTPEGVSRKSISVYYYTKERPQKETTGEHNTIYVNTEGPRGLLKNFKSGVRAFFERIKTADKHR